jgi:ISXO2-like transposase domain
MVDDNEQYVLAAAAEGERAADTRSSPARPPVLRRSSQLGIFKRRMVGVYQHCGEQHLQRYLSEFEFRYNNRIRLGVHDEQRARIAAYGMNHKRLTYRRPDAA